MKTKFGRLLNDGTFDELAGVTFPQIVRFVSISGGQAFVPISELIRIGSDPAAFQCGYMSYPFNLGSELREISPHYLVITPNVIVRPFSNRFTMGRYYLVQNSSQGQYVKDDLGNLVRLIHDRKGMVALGKDDNNCSIEAVTFEKVDAVMK